MGGDRRAVTPTRARAETVTGGQVSPAPYVVQGGLALHQPLGVMPASNRTPSKAGSGRKKHLGSCSLPWDSRH